MEPGLSPVEVQFLELSHNRADMDLVSKLLPTHQGRMCVSLKVRYGASGKAVYKSGKVTYKLFVVPSDSRSHNGNKRVRKTVGLPASLRSV